MLSWRVATETALYGTDGFFVRHRPAHHFRTSATTSPLFAAAIARLAESVDSALRGPSPFHIVDVGAGRGELLTGIAAALSPAVRTRTSLVAVERARRPPDLPDGIAWREAPPQHITGLLVACEWLDNVPLDVAELDEAGERRLVLVDPGSGAECFGDPVTGEDAAWLDQWWPVEEPGFRAEIGRPRDAAWASAVTGVDRGLALAVDYGHILQERPVTGTLTGYRDGRQVPPVPDGSCDVTAHVAVDAVAAAGAQVAGTEPMVRTQREALRALGLDARRPPLSLAATDPAGYVRALAAATQAADLTDPAGLGAHYWLLQPVGMTLSLG